MKEEKTEIKKEEKVYKKANIQEQKPDNMKDALLLSYKYLSLMTGTKYDEKESENKTLEYLAKESYNKISKLVKFDSKGDVKQFKLKGNVRSKLKKLAKKNKIMVLILRSNRSIEPVIMNLNSGYIVLDGVPRLVEMDYIYLWNYKAPCIVIPEWSLEPIGTKDYYKKNPAGLSLPAAEKAILAIAQSGDVLTKPKMSGKMLVFGAIGIIVFIYIIMGGASP